VVLEILPFWREFSLQKSTCTGCGFCHFVENISWT